MPDTHELHNTDGFAYRDLNKNGRMDPYEDTRLPLEERVADLLSQMTLEEKAGLMFHTIMPVGQDGSLVEGASMFGPFTTSIFVREKLINHFNVHQLPAPRLAAEWHNRLQKMAEETRLGIPVTLSSDPRHGFSHNVLTSFRAASFSQWPEPIGLAATGDEDLVREFGDIARQEYLAVGIRTALHPMADLATEPRWARINGTFGEDAALSARMVSAYIRGFQGEHLDAHSVACMTKHFPGGGPQKDGLDAHFGYGKEQVYPGDNFDYHLRPFVAAFQAGTAQIMPYYGQPIGLPIEEVGFGFNKEVITGLLRAKYGFDGVVCTDWGLINPVMRDGKIFMDARCWGVEPLVPEERVLKALDADVDQFGGEACPELIVDLVHSGRLIEARIDRSARRLLRDKFRLGLFDDPYVDPQSAETTVGRADFFQAGETAQRKSIVVLKNGELKDGQFLPVKNRPRVYLEGIDPQTAGAYAQVVPSVGEAELAILRLNTPSQPNEAMGFFASIFHEGDLDFKGEEKARLLRLLEQIPTIVVIEMDRPAVIPEIARACAGLLATFGASDASALDIIFGRFSPVGKLPFELPSSMEAVRKQKEDLPYDSENPLFPFGFGLTF
jgi:beta-glucosidase